MAEPSDYVLAYDIEENTGTTVAEKNGGPSLTIAGTTPPGWIAGPSLTGIPSSAHALGWTGNGHANNDSITDPIPANVCTVGLLIRPDAVRNGAAFGIGTTNNGVLMEFWGDNTVYAGWSNGGSFHQLTYGYSGDLDTWHIYLMTITDNGANNTVRLYVDDMSTETSSLTNSANIPATTAICLGKSQSSSGNWGDLDIANFRLWDRVLNQTEREQFGIEAASVIQQFNLDAVLRAQQTRTFSLDAILKDSFEKNVSVDAILKAEFVKAFGLDAVMVPSGAEVVFQLDAVIAQLDSELTYGLDAVVTQVAPLTFNLDALVIKTTELSFGIDAVINTSKLFGLDALLKRAADLDVTFGKLTV